MACVVYILEYPSLLPSTAHLYSYQKKYCESLYPFDIISLYSLSVPFSLFRICCVRTIFDSFHVTYIKLAMSYFHNPEWLFLCSWLYKGFEEIVLYHIWYCNYFTIFLYLQSISKCMWKLFVNLFILWILIV